MLEWQVKTIKDLGKVVTGKTPSKENNEFYNDGELPFVSPKDLDWNSYYVYDTQTKVTDKAYESQKNQRVPKNSVFYTSLSFAIGKIGIASGESLTNQQIHSIVVNDKHDYRFVYYLLQQYRPYIFCFNSGIDTPIVPKSVFEKINVVVPDLDIQKKIAAILSAYDDLIENNKKRIQILESMAEELYKEWFVRFRFPNYEKTEFEKGIPKDWSYTTLEHLGKIRTGKTPSTSNSEFYGGEYPFYKTPDMHDKVFVFETDETLTEQGLNSQKSQIIEANAIMVTCIGSGGVTAISTKKGCTNQQINSLSVANSKFLYWAYYSIKYLKPQIELYGATGATMTNLSKGKFSNLEVVKPTDELIEKYFNLVTPKFEMIKKLFQMNQILEEQKGSLLPRLISGKLSVENLDIQFSPSMQES
ncbi:MULTISPECIES: restriction endonuclease subunit S [unclassified Acinetobacter]|uniref:restriction endonuclease subunit S n=1 Tax=unclassified Acinetobacter TaxID=196816 RepID=UPI00287C2556|nr:MULTISPECIES: restriction endonuclease subunit S [unclassified Acinetobacter]MDS7959224.1 restriction endonuclease subunit S [Acinetobacter sp. V104_13]MDS7983353.1 restriction endonuclease subunit S [Acinetobacter sp. V104_3]